MEAHSRARPARYEGLNGESCSWDCNWSVRRTAKDDLKLHPYKLQKVQYLTDNKRMRIARCKRLLRWHAHLNWDNIPSLKRNCPRTYIINVCDTGVANKSFDELLKSDFNLFSDSSLVNEKQAATILSISLKAVTNGIKFCYQKFHQLFLKLFCKHSLIFRGHNNNFSRPTSDTKRSQKRWFTKPCNKCNSVTMHYLLQTKVHLLCYDSLYC